MLNLSVKYQTITLTFIIFILCITSIEAKKEKVLSFEAAWPNVEVFFPVDLDSYAGQVYVTSLGGQIYYFANNDAVAAGDIRIFFDLSSPAANVPFFTNYYVGGDEGLLSMEFHPLYPSVPKIYTFHSSSDKSVRVTAWNVVNGVVDYTSADMLIEIPKPLAKLIETPYSTIYEAYLGGDLRFLKEDRPFCESESSSSSESAESEDSEEEDRRRSPRDNSDYNLYISVGYGNDDTSAQDLHNYLGKILRITPSKTSKGYTIPCNNPYVSGPSAAAGLDEIYARGLRNPRKIYFSEDPDDLFIGDVGVAYDEVDRLYNAGQNFGWPKYDGCATQSSLYTFPIYTYTSSSSHTVTMGPYYTGPIKSLKNRMLFADLYSGQLYSIQATNTKECKTVPIPVAVAPAAISAFVVIDNVVYVSNVFGAFYGSPNFYRLVEH